jgi:hypothetical protein
VLGLEPGRCHRALVVEREPFLNALHSGAMGKIREQSQVQRDRRRKN